MAVKARREREKENLRQEILDAAREMFAAEGYKNVSMRKIADKIEYSPTTIYLYFKDKSDLLHQICEETFDKLARRLEQITAAEQDALAALRKGLRAYIEFGLEYPNHYEVTFITPLIENIEKEERSFENSLGQRAFGFLKKGVAEAIAAGKIKKGDVDLISQTLWAGIHGLTSLLIGHSDFPFVEREKLIDSLIETLIKGLKN